MISQKLIGIIIFLIFISFLFYWYQYRPSQIKASCARITLAIAQREAPSGGTPLVLNKIGDAVYKNCLHQKGL